MNDRCRPWKSMTHHLITHFKICRHARHRHDLHGSLSHFCFPSAMGQRLPPCRFLYLLVQEYKPCCQRISSYVPGNEMPSRLMPSRGFTGTAPEKAEGIALSSYSLTFHIAYGNGLVFGMDGDYFILHAHQCAGSACERLRVSAAQLPRSAILHCNKGKPQLYRM